MSIITIATIALNTFPNVINVCMTKEGKRVSGLVITKTRVYYLRHQYALGENWYDGLWYIGDASIKGVTDLPDGDLCRCGFADIELYLCGLKSL